jgi:DNA polymerase-3 subunit beta
VTEFAASREPRYAIDGILTESAAAADEHGRRRRRWPRRRLETAATATVHEIVPPRATLRALGPGAEVAGISITKRRVLLRCGDTVLSATSRDAEFPDYRGVVPAEDTGSVVQLARDEFFQCVRQAAVMAGDDAPAVALTFTEGSLVIAGRHEGRGDARSEMPVDYVGPEVKIAFNPAFLLDFAKLRLPEKIPFAFRDSTAACVFRPAPGFAYVVMPMSL